MAHHNNTPAQFLEDLKPTKRIVEGTEFAGINREGMRRHGHLGEPKPGKWAGSRKPVEHWVAKRLKELAQQKSEFADATMAAAQEVPFHAYPMTSASRLDNYSNGGRRENLTPRQRRRLNKEAWKFLTASE